MAAPYGLKENSELGVLLGFDPGGASAFGWCVVADAASLPSLVVASGLASDARKATAAALAAVPTGEHVVAAAIDAPLVWPRVGGRDADSWIRQAMQRAGAANAAGTVQHVNSLRGACLAQGLLAAIELREALPDLPISEAHPKALRHLCSAASRITGSSEHERDAIVSTFSAWAFVHKPAGWHDLFADERPYFTPILPPLAYLMPTSVT